MYGLMELSSCVPLLYSAAHVSTLLILVATWPETWSRQAVSRHSECSGTQTLAGLLISLTRRRQRTKRQKRCWTAMWQPEWHSAKNLPPSFFKQPVRQSKKRKKECLYSLIVYDCMTLCRARLHGKLLTNPVTIIVLYLFKVARAENDGFSESR